MNDLDALIGGSPVDEFDKIIDELNFNTKPMGEVTTKVVDLLYEIIMIVTVHNDDEAEIGRLVKQRILDADLDK